ncbi:MAG: Glu-tRNA(Gln) amidotransferase subunit GatE [Candidatus Aenigmatarchaeota archaeon]|nr:MAG: Glu-tRNA(Gln) amidotransferase subunit GatE [Candidatus Aenigmarchaeota archaeon]
MWGKGMDYEKIGLKCGIEIHQQLDTQHKLFCSCQARLSPLKPDTEIVRKLRAVAGELGEIDIAALSEFLRGREFVYWAYPEETCLVESDEEPPHELNRESLDVALTIAEFLKCEVPEEIHVMRKTVLDGSNTSGFQRTAIVGMNGRIRTSFGEVGVTNLCLEEESAQILGGEGNRVIYGLDRLGIPLVEIGTSPDIRSPEQAREVAEKLGMIVRSTGKAKRGIGTIRQDINVSISGGARIEIKGAQELRLIPKLVENEVTRQMHLLEIKKELKRMKFKPVKPRILHVSHIFRGSKSRMTMDKKTYAVLIPDFAGFLKRKITPVRTLGNEIADYVRAKSELKGIIHSDEDLEKYELSKEFEKLRKRMKAGKGDTLIIAAGEDEHVRRTMGIVCERINSLVKGVPEEVRRALETGDTEYMRPLPGAARLYPETDIPPIKITDKRIRDIRKSLPELIEEREEKGKREIKKKAKISDEIIDQIVKMGKKEIFDKLIKSGYDPKTVSSVLTSTLRYLEKREKVSISKLKDSHFLSMFQALEKGRISKEAIPGVLKSFAEHPDEKIEKVIKKLGIKTLTEKELKGVIRKTVRENRTLLKDPRGEKILLGLVMKKVRGRANARKVMDILKKELK